jgi:hypothetical protein
MAIDLNSILFDEKIEVDKILKEILQEDIYSYYMNEECFSGKTTKSPFRVDNIPSFTFYYHKTDKDKLMHYDRSTGESGDCFIFVSKLLGLSYIDSLKRIIADFKGATTNYSIPDKSVIFERKNVRNKEKVEIGIRKRKWLEKDRLFWSQFSISKKTLELFKVCPIDYVFYNGKPVKTEDLSYAYLELKDNIYSYKIYQPLSKSFKWINNADYSVHQGYTQLPSSGKLLIITKSLKDVMSLYDVLGINAIGLQSESVNIKSTVLDEYKSRFEQVICLFDNDNPGVNFSKKISKDCEIDYFLIPLLKNVKDFSDLVRVKGKEKAIKVFNNSLKTMNKNEKI